MDIANTTQQDADMFTGTINKPQSRPNIKGKLAGYDAHNMERIDKTSEDFEAQFVSQMVSTMFSTEEEDKFTGGGSGEQMYKSFLSEEYGKIITKSGGIGVSAQVKQELLRLQEAENHPDVIAKTEVK